jgi:uncharacterized protein YbaR (Trm112 family)
MPETGPLGLPAALWDVLACPCPEHAPLRADEEAGELVCTSCGRRFAVRDGIPVLLLDEAVEG